MLPLAQGIRIQWQAGVMPGQRRDLAAGHLRLQYHGPVGGDCRPLQKAIQAAVAVVAQCHVVRHREARLLRRHAQKRHGVCVHLHQGEEQLYPLLPRRPPVRQGQGGPVGAVRQALLRRAGLAGHRGPPSRAAHSTRSRAGPAGPLGGGVHQGAEPLFQSPGASGELLVRGRAAPRAQRRAGPAPYLRRHSPSRPASTAASQAISISRSAARRSSQTRGLNQWRAHTHSSRALRHRSRRRRAWPHGPGQRPAAPPPPPRAGGCGAAAGPSAPGRTAERRRIPAPPHTPPPGVHHRAVLRRKAAYRSSRPASTRPLRRPRRRRPAPPW